ncbi:MAG: NUDIX domain-containing protein [Methanocorpusculum sp.]|nr:NUDIX domain-containing protein [Methanocorpusculum sp.]
MRTYVLGFIFTADESGLLDVLLIRKHRPEPQVGKLNGIGGKVEDGELPVLAMCRECEEEIRLTFHQHDWTEFGTVQGTDFKIHLFYLLSPAIQLPYRWTAEGLLTRMSVDSISAYEHEFVNHTPACIMAAIAHHKTRNFNLHWVYDTCDEKTLDRSVKD